MWSWDTKYDTGYTLTNAEEIIKTRGSDIFDSAVDAETAAKDILDSIDDNEIFVIGIETNFPYNPTGFVKRISNESINEYMSPEYKMVEYTYDGDEISDYLGHVRVRTDSDKIALRAAEKYAIKKHFESNPRYFKICNDNYTNVDVIDSDGDYLTTLES